MGSVNIYMLKIKLREKDHMVITKHAEMDEEQRRKDSIHAFVLTLW